MDKNFEDRFKELNFLFVEKEFKYNIFNKLDNIIINKEIFVVIFFLKCGKVKGLDFILNEMLKSGYIFFIFCLLKLFNLCFFFSYYLE